MNILRGFKAMTAFILVAAFFTGCSEDQTSLDVSSIPGRAKVIGSLAYSEGTILEGGKFKEQIKPAIDKEVYLEISNSDFNNTAVGVSTWKTKTNAEGRFEIDVPVPANGATITIKPVEFTGNFSTVVVKENKPEIDSLNCVYAVLNNNVISSAKANQIFFADMRYVRTSQQELEKGYNTTVPLKGQIGIGKLLSVTNTTTGAAPSYNTPYFYGQAGIDAVITIIYDDEDEDYVRTYNATSGQDGYFNLDIPVRSTSCNLTCLIETLPFVANNFTYYAYNSKIQDYVAESLSGVYHQFDTFTSNNETFVGKIAELQYESLNESYTVKATMVFDELFAGQNTTYNFNNYSWSTANWWRNDSVIK